MDQRERTVIRVACYWQNPGSGSIWIQCTFLHLSDYLKIVIIKYWENIFNITEMLLKYKSSNLGQEKTYRDQEEDREWYSILLQPLSQGPIQLSIKSLCNSHSICETIKQIGLISPILTTFCGKGSFKPLFTCFAVLNCLCILNIFKIVLFKTFHFHYLI